MSKFIIPFASSDAKLQLAGGKAANLSELTRAKFTVPPGFIVSTDAYKRFVESNQLQAGILALSEKSAPDNLEALEAVSSEIRALFEHGNIPEDIASEVLAAYHAIANDVQSPPVAVRSSATAEDLPGLAFAGQQDTYLNIVGDDAVLDAVKRCWGSLWTARAIAYRARNQIASNEVALAVVVQQMIESEVSGITFTANPITGRRGEIVINASYGLGEAIVSGQVEPDRYIVEPGTWKIIDCKLGAKALAIVSGNNGGTEQVEHQRGHEQALPDVEIVQLAQLAAQVEKHFGNPQDIEWAWAKGQFYLLQSRPITSLYPLPPAPTDGLLHVYFSFNSLQGVIDPFTPLGLGFLRIFIGAVFKLLGIKRPPQEIMTEAGGRIFIDMSYLLGDKRLRPIAFGLLANADPAARQIVQRLMEQGLIPQRQVTSPAGILRLMATLASVFLPLIPIMTNPEKGRERVVANGEKFIADLNARAQESHNLAELLSSMERDMPGAERISFRIVPLILQSVVSLTLLKRWLPKWIDEKPENILQLVRSLPGNVTTEMDLTMWAATQKIRADAQAAEALRSQSLERLEEAYQQNRLPEMLQRAVSDFMNAYGMRGVVEIDFGRSPWRDDPAPVLQMLRGQLQQDNPNLAPDISFQRGAAEAERLAEDYKARVRKTKFGWLRAHLVSAMIRRIRQLGGLRESPKFYLIRIKDIYRTKLLEYAKELVAQKQLDEADDIFMLPFDSLKQFAEGKALDLNSIATANRANYERERARKRMPRILLSTGEAFYEGMSNTAGEHDLLGDPVSSGVIEGKVRVILDPRGAHLEPGEILVCPSTDPGWTPLFMTAGGLVMEIGGLMTHGSIVAREYGIPAIVGVHEATTRLKTGQLIRVDGNAGHITLL